MFTKILIPIFALALAISLSGIVVLKQNINQGGENALRQLNNESSENVKEKEVEQITSDIDTSDWKTYRNEELGFEFKYPRNLYILDNLKDSSDRKLYISTEEIAYDEFLNGYNGLIFIEPTNSLNPGLNIQEKSKISINNTSGEYIVSMLPERKPSFPELVVIIVDFDNPEIIMQTNTFVDAKDNNLLLVINEILYTFKVLDN